MQVAVTGVNFTNKGAQLMLRAVLDELARWPEAPDVGLPLTSGSAADRRSVGARTLLVRSSDRPRPWRTAMLAVANRLPRAVADRAGWMRVRDVDLVLDASGFAYSDQWGAARVGRTARLYAGFAGRGQPVILLPQALGPFSTPSIATAFRDLAASTRVVFARDPDSLAHARAAAPAADLRLAPDFTAAVGVDDGRRDHVSDAGRAVVIPNLRMLDRTAAADQAWYLDAVAHGFAWLQQQGTAPYVLLVEAGDRAVLDRLPEPARSAEVVWEPDPQRIKQGLRAARLVLGARYHGLASALSQGVPAVGLGWSHKYAALFEDHGVPDLLLRTGADHAELERQLARLLDPDERAAITTVLAERSTAIRAATDAMWADVRRVAGV